MNIRNYIYSHCVHPVKVKIWDAYLNRYVVREVPCGKCLHCRNSRINEWVTRLFAEYYDTKYSYYISLDYAPFSLSNKTALQLAAQTAACYHNVNSTHHFGMHPLVLNKMHLQKFYKRLRYNTGISVQYFACGEYGMHANGHGYGRPHFHNIIFSNEPISKQQFIDAWSLNGYQIGRVDFIDLHSVSIDDNENTKIFKYVAKYLQKADFNFEMLATINFHRTYFESLSLAFKQEDLFTSVPEYSVKTEYSWHQYIKDFSPFVVCSRRPAIGANYFAKHVERFTKQDFRLFGLPDACCAFPHYFLRRAKEVTCPLVAIGSISQKPASSSRLGYISKILHQILYSQTDVSNFVQEFANTWRFSRKDENELKVPAVKWFNNGEFVGCLPLSDLHFYDMSKRIFYQFNGYNYTLWKKFKKSSEGLYKLGDLDLTSVLNLIDSSYKPLYDNFIRPFHDLKVLKESELYDTISQLYNDEFLEGGKTSYEKFLDEVYAIYQDELATNYKNKLLMSNSKQTL